MTDHPRVGLAWAARLPFFYGWVVVAVAFVTLAIGVRPGTRVTSEELPSPPQAGACDRLAFG